MLGIALIASLMLWTARALRNLRALGYQRDLPSPILGAVSWAIPLLNLVLPCIVVRRIWLATHRVAAGSADGPVRGAGLVLLWWGLWLAVRFGSRAAGVDPRMAVAALLAALGTCVLTVVIVVRVTRRQNAAFRQLVPDLPARPLESG